VLVRQLGGHVVELTSVDELERLGQAPMVEPLTRRGDRGVRSIAEQVVGEVVAKPGLVQDAPTPQLIDGAYDGVRVEVAGLADQLQTEVPADGSGQPSDLLRRRPDLIAAEARVAAETLRGAEARAQWWPKLFLSALFGREDLRLNALDLAPVHFSNVALAFAAPIFNAGRIDAGIRVQSARADEALLAWQKAVLVAVQEVESSLLVRTEEAERAAALSRTVDHRRRSLQRAQSLQREGQIDLLVLLDVQRSVLASELALSDSRLQQVLADVQLYKALGGGFAPAGAVTTSLARTPL
jgi:outer membrane protein TolC